MSQTTPAVAIPTETIEISIAHSPDSDDAFMFYGLATNKVRVPGYKFTHTLCDIETLRHSSTSPPSAFTPIPICKRTIR
jgi:predicted solute-binding protein